MSDQSSQPNTFSDVSTRELQAILQRRAGRTGSAAEKSQDDEAANRDRATSGNDAAWNAALVGLALSGGGIRSATFNLGFIQALAKLGLLRHIDYLSTVSGGGYIGAWLSALLTRTAKKSKSSAVQDVSTILASSGDGENITAVAHLRTFSNYLTPKLGMFSADTWSALTTYVRNLFLNVPMILGAMAVVTLALRLAQCGLTALASASSLAWVLPLLVALFTVGASFGLVRNMAAFQAPGEVLREDWRKRFDSQSQVIMFTVFPAVLASAAASVWLPGLRPQEYAPAWLVGGDYISTAMYVAIGTSLIWIAAWLRAKSSEMRHIGIAWVSSGFASGFVSGCALWWIVEKFIAPLPPELQIVVGPPLLLIWVTAQGFLQIGLLGRKLPDEQREWMSRLGGWLLIAAFAWASLLGIIFFGHLLLMSCSAFAKLGLLSGWVVTAIAAALAGRGTGIQTGARKMLSALIVPLAPYVFILGLVGLLTAALNAGLLTTAEYLSEDAEVAATRSKMNVVRDAFVVGKTTNKVVSGRLDAGRRSSVGTPPKLRSVRAATTFKDVWVAYQALYHRAQDWRAIVFWILGATVVFGVLSWRVSINGFSLSRFYANRLVRCYLGASLSDADRYDTTNPFTEFSQADDLCVADLRHDGPYHIVNSAINLVAGDNLAWQERKAGPFVVTPDYYGFALADGKAGRGCFRPTNTDRNTAAGWTLGEAMATSGAAASPNMGYHSTPAFAFLLTLLNIRLGRWIGNPNHAVAWRKPSPLFTVWYLLLELFGLTKSKSKFVYLSDGGHFDNLGVYELVRRRCRYVIACDVGADGGFEFDDLGNMIRKCRADLGIDIQIDVKEIRERDERGRCGRHCAIGEIHYPGGKRGTLLYIKSSLTGDEPEDVLNYARQHQAFPHQPTGDQFFSESQFESYRSLGEHIGLAVLTPAVTEAGGAQLNVESLFVALRQHWHATARASSESFLNHSHRLDAMLERLRNTPILAYLDREFYPELRVFEDDDGRTLKEILKLPEDAHERRAGFYFCNSLIHLMEDVYLDLGLEGDWAHPNNTGWMNLFKHWSWSPMFRATWSVCAATSGSRFQKFCERRLDLGLGSVFAQRVDFDLEPSGALNFTGAKVTLNFLECEQIKAIVVGPDPAKKSHYALYQLDLQVDSGVPGHSLMQFNFGYCLTRGDDLVVFRIQDHLRNRGLGREALECLLRDQPGLTPPKFEALPGEVRALMEGRVDADGWGDFIRLVQSVRRQFGA